MRSRVEELQRENKQLRKRLELTERDNQQLKASVYDLSTRLSAITERSGRATRPFDVDDLEGSGSQTQQGPPDDEGEQTHLPKETRAEYDEHAVDGRHFALKYDLKGHTGAVYTVRFSPNGRLLASGSFDRSVRCGTIEDMERGDAITLQEHRHSVSSLAWSSDSSLLLSGSYDHTVRQWDVGATAQTSCWTVPESTFVQSVCYQPPDSRVFAVGTTGRSFLLYDSRESGGPAATVMNESMVNSLIFMPNAVHVLTGDKHGALRTWDIRRLACVSSAYLSEVCAEWGWGGGEGEGGCDVDE